MKFRLPVLIAAVCTGLFAAAAERIDLGGEWRFSSDSVSAWQTISLPGTTETNRIGEAAPASGETTRLSRRRPYEGKAWYSRDIDIPSDWAGRHVYLTLERTKPSVVYIDSKKAGESTDISTPQEFDLSGFLTPGRHTLTVMVDNSSGIPEQIYASSHACTDDTQTNWNGIIGEIYLSTEPFSAPAITETHPAFRNFGIRGQQFYADGHLVFLRGRHDACVWPLTGHVAMDLESWRRYFDICRQYGLNHVRFHSWCPPEAAFAAADEAGIYLQPELPFWGDFNENDSVLMTFLHKEGLNILRRYGHHPSFRMFALGNELWGSIDKMAQFTDDFRKAAPDKIYTFGSNYYLGYEGMKPGMDFFVTCRAGGEGWGNYNTHTRGSFSFADAADGGIINHFRPGTRRNFEEACLTAGVPVISHESGQFQIYPEYGQIGKYTGVLAPCNLEVFRARLDSAGMADLAEEFHKASGLWAVELYKQDIEMDLRTPAMAGFQLLDIQDYPGQGSAYVGILDAFLDSKGLCTPEEWRGWCSEVVPLMIADSFCHTSGKGLHATVKIANYGGKSLAGRTLRWTLGDRCGTLAIPDGEGLVEVGYIDIDLAGFAAPSQQRLTLDIDGTDCKNRYNIWIYPDSVNLESLKENIHIARELSSETFRKLEDGASVLLMPGPSEQTVGALFQTDYWNYRMFRTICENNGKTVSPGTLGILTDPSHPLFGSFPTAAHTDWQWFPVVKNSSPFILDSTDSSYRPIVQVIDNIERNHKLGLVFEFAVGRGRLLVAMADLDKAAEYPEGRQFYASLLRYMYSPDFRPATCLTPDALRRLFSAKARRLNIDSLNNISPY